MIHPVHLCVHHLFDPRPTLGEFVILSKRIIAFLVGTGVLVAGGIAVAVVPANADVRQIQKTQTQTRTVRIWYKAAAGIGYAGKVCARSFMEQEYYWDKYEENSFDWQCDNSVLVGQKGSITIRVPSGYEGYTVKVEVKGGNTTGTSTVPTTRQ